MPIVDTATNGWQRVGVHELGWRKSLRAKHWAQVQRAKSGLGWDWGIFKADPVTMRPTIVADGMDISLAAAKDDVDHWNDHYHAHAVVIRGAGGQWSYECRICDSWSIRLSSFDEALGIATRMHSECEAAWQRGDR